MRIIRTITYYSGDSITNEIPTHLIEQGDQVRVGFEKGILLNARFELASGAVIEYRLPEEAK